MINGTDVSEDETPTTATEIDADHIAEEDGAPRRGRGMAEEAPPATTPLRRPLEIEQ